MLFENKAKLSPMQIIGIVVIFVLAVLIILTFVLFGIFKDSNSAPKLFGHRVYVVTNDRMEPRIPEGAAVFVDEGTLPQADSQSVILCNIEGGLYVIGFIGTETTESGAVSYIVKYDNATDDKTWGVSQDDIVGVAQTYDEFFGWMIRFASSKAGMMIIVIIPCLLIIVYEIGMLLLSKNGGGFVRRREPQSENAYESNSANTPFISRVDSPDLPDIEGITPAAEDIHIPVDEEAEELSVEEHLRIADDKLSSAVHEAHEVTEPEEIELDSIEISHDEPIEASAPSAEPEIESPVKPAEKKFSADDLSAARIDELIKLLEEEKKRLADK